MTDITVTLTSTEYRALEYAATSVQDWADNALKNRARIAKIEILEKLLEHCNANNIQLAVGEDAQVTQAYELGVVDTLANVTAIAEESRPE